MPLGETTGIRASAGAQLSDPTYPVTASDGSHARFADLMTHYYGSLRVEYGSDSGRSVFSQPWVDDHGVEQVAAVAGVSVHPVDTLASPPAPGTPASEATYFAQMEHLLGVLSGALGCRAGNQ